MKDELGERMKEFYENRTQHTLPRRTYTIIRLDGKAFHTYLRGFKRPYDERIMRVMDSTAIALCKQIQGAKLAFVQSDEISIVLTDFDDIKTDAWFDGNIQKIVSVSASIATVAFNNGMYLDEDILADMSKVAYFDSRVFTIPDREEIINLLIWRQQDATRNSIQMGAQSLYSQKELHGKNTDQLQELMFQKGQNWSDYPVGFKRGRIILKEKIEYIVPVNPTARQPEIMGLDAPPPVKAIERRTWASFDPPVFTQDRKFLQNRIPSMRSNLYNSEKQDETTKNSKKKGITNKLTYNQFIEFTKVKKCVYCDETVEWMEHIPAHYRGRSGYNLDRKDSDKGYSKENCVVCCKICNWSKNELFSHQEFLEIGIAIGNVLRKRKI